MPYCSFAGYAILQVCLALLSFTSGSRMYAVLLVISIYAVLLVCGLMHDVHCTLVIITTGL
jgi:hypothetical protein